MTTSIRALLFIFFHFFSVHSMEHKIPLKKYYLKTKKQKSNTKKDPRLLLALPDEILGNIAITVDTKPFSFLNSIVLLLNLSKVCQTLEHLHKTDELKRQLRLTQRRLDRNLFLYGFIESKDNFTPFLKLLITMGANVNRHCDNLLKCVSLTQNRYILTHFINLNTNINYQNKREVTPLLRAIYLDKAKFVKILLDHKANPYLPFKNRYNSIEIALILKRINCLKVLIQHGIDTTIKYNICNPPITIAKWAKLHKYDEIYGLVTNKKTPKRWYKI